MAPRRVNHEQPAKARPIGAQIQSSRRRWRSVVDDAEMEILLVSSEIAPWVQISGVSEVVASHSKTLKQLGHSVTVVVPYSNAYETAGLLLARRLTPLAIQGGDSLTVYDTQLSSGVQLVLLSVESGAEDRHCIKAAVRFAQAVAALVKERSDHGTPTDVVHAHDWFSGLVALAMEIGGGPRPPVVFTVYDIGRDAVSPEPFDVRSELGSLASMPELALDGGPSILAAALRTASRVTAVNEAYARSLGDAAFAGRIANIVSELKGPILGIPVGIDYSRFNPATDPFLVARYDAEDFLQKGTCKTALQRELGLDLELECPLFFVPGPRSDDLAGRLVSNSLLRLLDQHLNLVVAANFCDARAVTSEIQRVAQQWPRRIAVLNVDDAQDLHRAMSAADFVVLAGRESPLDVHHLFAQRYGAIPIASTTLSYFDGLVDCDAKLQTGNAFVFETLNLEDLIGAVGRAATAWKLPDFNRLRRRIMRQDLGWERPARRFVQVYRQVLGIRL